MCRCRAWTPITPQTGSFFYAESQVQISTLDAIGSEHLDGFRQNPHFWSAAQLQ
jgi:hypothetical protein